MTAIEYDKIISEIAESEIPAREFRIVDNILRRFVEDENGNDCKNPAE